MQDEQKYLKTTELTYKYLAAAFKKARATQKEADIRNAYKYLKQAR
jgi:hypothetical protein